MKLKKAIKEDRPSRQTGDLPIHRDFKPIDTKPSAGVPSNRQDVAPHPDSDPTQTAQPTASKPKRVEPKISNDARRAAGDYVPDDDPSVNPNAPKRDINAGPDLDRNGNPIEKKPQGPQSDAMKKFKPLVKGADGKWGSGEPAQPKISSADRAAAGDYNADDDKTLDRNKGGEDTPNPTPWRPKEKDGGQSDAMKNFKPLKRGVDFDNDPKQSDAMKSFKPLKRGVDFKDVGDQSARFDDKLTKPKKKSKLNLGNVMKGIKDKLR
jgi:hypothetical protein